MSEEEDEELLANYFMKLSNETKQLVDSHLFVLIHASINSFRSLWFLDNDSFDSFRSLWTN